MRLQVAAENAGISLVVGTIEECEGNLYNAAWLFVPGEDFQSYRKTHLPVLGIDRFATPGSDLPVFDLPCCKLGIIICFDLRIPEAART
ncbi:carbon-nitrogen hydrolase family protein, partial [Acinetobacter baumannii]